MSNWGVTVPMVVKMYCPLDPVLCMCLSCTVNLELKLWLNYNSVNLEIFVVKIFS